MRVLRPKSVRPRAHRATVAGRCRSLHDPTRRTTRISLHCGIDPAVSARQRTIVPGRSARPASHKPEGLGSHLSEADADSGASEPAPGFRPPGSTVLGTSPDPPTTRRCPREARPRLPRAGLLLLRLWRDARTTQASHKRTHSRLQRSNEGSEPVTPSRPARLSSRVRPCPSSPTRGPHPTSRPGPPFPRGPGLVFPCLGRVGLSPRLRRPAACGASAAASPSQSP